MNAIELRAANGQFVAQDFVTRYPTGRKHCACCRRWRLVTDFSPAKWADKTKTIIRKVLSYCTFCAADKQRQRKGYSRRTVCDGQVGTEPWRQRRLAKKRAHYRLMRQNPFWVQARHDYVNERTRQAAYAKWSKPKPDPAFKAGEAEMLEAARFVEYLDKWTTTQADWNDKTCQLATFINGFRVTDNEGRMLRRWRNEVKRVKLSKADEWAVRFDLPLWEIEEAAA